MVTLAVANLGKFGGANLNLDDPKIRPDQGPGSDDQGDRRRRPRGRERDDQGAKAATTKGQGATTKGQGATTKGQGATTKGQGATTKGQGATTKGQGATTKGQGGSSGNSTVGNTNGAGLFVAGMLLGGIGEALLLQGGAAGQRRGVVVLRFGLGVHRQ